MNDSMKSSKAVSYIRKHKILATSVAVVALLVVFIALRSRSAPKFETATATIDSVVESVSVTGTISPVGKADLGFEKSGAIAHIYVAVGDRVKAGDRIASLDSASDEANYRAALATSADTARGLRPEEQAAQEADVNAAQVALSNAQKNGVDAAHDAYAKAQSALVTYTDQLFQNPASVNPTITIPTQSYSSKSAIQDERVSVTDALADWTRDISLGATSSADDLIAKSRAHLAVIKTFMTDLSAIVGDLTNANSGLSQTTINGYTTAVNSALSTVNSAADSLTTAESSLDTTASALAQARSTYVVKAAGNSSDAIAAQDAKAAQAAAELAKDTILSPIDGVVTKVAPNEGEFVALGQTEFSVQSDGAFKIEAFVPEADIAKVAVGDLASTTLDAYGSDIDFESRVTAIDPAETVIEGVPTYKVTLMFLEPDARIRSGMTANLEILTHVRSGVVAIPYRAVQDENGVKVVRLLSPDGKSFSTTTVSTGLKGSNGLIEIDSGLEAGQKVVTYVK